MRYQNSDEYSEEDEWDSDEDREQYSDGTFWIKSSVEPIKISLGPRIQDNPDSDHEDTDDEADDGCESDHSANSDASYFDGDIDDYGSVEDVKQFRIKIGKLMESGFKEQSRGDFAGYGALPYAPNPGIAVECLGLIRLPLDEVDAQRIISQSEQAPFGKKSKTIVDLSIRKTWQIDGSKIYFENPNWIIFLEEKVIPKAAEKLGLDPRQIGANLYKLLLYGEGGHFEAHQDTEKEPGMFGTLIIVLPSPFTGGSVTASHDSKEMEFDTASGSKFGTYYTCIYSDVFHKVHPVTSGYRLVLSYNLIFNIQSEPRPKAPPVNVSTEELRNLLNDWIAQLDSGKDLPRFIMHVLGHKYSRVGLDFANIKGKDRAKVDFLKSIAEELGFEIYLAQIDITVEGHHEDDEPTGDPYHDYTIQEIGKCSYELKDVVDPEGKEIDLSKMMINRYDAVPRMRYLQVRADNREHERFTGNEGCEVTHYYYRTALLLWPKSQKLFMDIRASGLKSTIANLKERFACYKRVTERGTNNVADHDELKRFSRTVASAYLRHSLSSKSEITQCVKTLREIAITLNAPEVFVQTMIRSRSRLSELRAADYVTAIKTFGFAPLQETMEEALKEIYIEMDIKDSLWRFHFISELVRSVPDDKTLKTWSGKQQMLQLQKVIIFDDKALDYAVNFVQRKIFRACEEMLTEFLQNMEKIQRKTPTSPRLKNTPCQFVVKIFGRMVQDDDASKWCRNHLIRLAGGFSRKTDRRDIKSIVDFIRLCLHDPSLQTYISPILEAIERSAYEYSYFDNVICTIVEYLKTELDNSSLSWRDEPYISFASRIFMAGTAILQRPIPPLPDNYALPKDNKSNSLMNEFLCSAIGHVLVISKSNGVLREVDRVVRRLEDKISYETPEGKYKNCIIIRKLQFIVRNSSDPESKALLDTIQSRPRQVLDEWKKALCHQKEICECCLKIQDCIDWVEEQRIYARFCKVFGEDLVVIQKRIRTMTKSAPQIQAATTDKIVGRSTSSSAVNNNNASTSSGDKATTKLKSENTKKKRSAKEVADLTRSPIKTKKKSRQNV